MRMLHKLLFSLIVAIAFVTNVAADGPPPAPNGANRARVNRGHEVAGKQYRNTDAVEAAAADMAILSKIKSPEELCYYRYLTVHNLPPGMRLEGLKVTTFVLNSVSSNELIVVPAVGGPENILIRVNLYDYGIDPKVWDKFGNTDPYFHQLADRHDSVIKVIGYETKWVVTKEKYQDPKDGKWYYKQVQQQVPITQTEEVSKSKQLMQASWLNTNAMALLVDATQSSAPILRADWFITYGTLSPQYYDFLNFKKLDDYLNFIAFDKRALRREARATVVTSGSGGKCPRVSRNNRILRWTPTFNGGVWETFDYNASVGIRNVINNFLNNKRDAGEYIGNGPNGLQYYFLVDDKNNRLNEGAIGVVVDTMALDAVVKNGRSCIWCHSKGINGFDSQFQKQVGIRPDQSDLGIAGKEGKKIDPKEALELQKYIQKVFGAPVFDDIIKSGQRTYTEAVKKCNNLSAEENAAMFFKHWNMYFEDLIDMQRLVWETGYSEEAIRAAIPLRIDGRDDGVLLQQLLKEPISIRRDQFEEAFAGLQLRLLVVKDAKK